MTTGPTVRSISARDATISLTGRHERGQTLLPAIGEAILRGDPRKLDAPGAFLFWGPHSAGHQSPACLHADLHGGAHRLTDAPRSGGYGDTAHLTWNRTTISHNTVTVDGKPMYPYSEDTESIWDCDTYYDTPSDGTLELFQPGDDFSAVRASNDVMYPGVRLDRTLVVTRRFILDVYRVQSREQHQYDWAMHVIGQVKNVDAKAIDLGQRRGYQHLSNGRQLTQPGDVAALRFVNQCGTTHVQLATPTDGHVILADDPPAPEGDEAHCLGELDEWEPRTSLIARAMADKAVFVSLWQTEASEDHVSLAIVEAEADSDVVLRTGEQTWRIPSKSKSVERS